MNLPNKLTVSRFALTALFLWALFWPWPVPGRHTLALLFFCIAAFTDFLDGRVARARGLITNFGILMDPLADKILTCSAFIAFIQSSRSSGNAPSVIVAAWMVIIIVSRELAITGLRLLAASKNVVLAAENFGKHKTVSQIAAIIAILTVAAAPEWPLPLQEFLRPWSGEAARLLLWITVILTAVSGALYLWRNRRIYLTDM
ncbi:MAG: CDP-diacylglycerol--glycerol-3-phosphate 3-phosphatidyltransferase [Verrucomicrobia bacterium]|nr:CDP-diacylglycerol--glycerol-3-phosphate 3-phosphatidyltransferase [Verrucomicrobiota bacterium]MDE3098573.1 CDP-diacylglycerol--glycerol-3-phosphate 3-phosphatidyltransferase [Verrucomicrobiota bacterium]